MAASVLSRAARRTSSTQAAGPSEGVGPRVRIRLAPAASHQRTRTSAISLGAMATRWSIRRSLGRNGPSAKNPVVLRPSWKHLLVNSAERRRTRLPANDPEPAVQIPDRGRKSHGVRRRENGGEPGRACRQRVAERVMTWLSDPVFANEDLPGFHPVRSRPGLHLCKLRS